MYWLVENDEQLDYLKNQNHKEVFIEIIPLNDRVHPSINNISLLYFHPTNEDKGYMLCINHNDALKLEKKLISDLLLNIDKIWVRDKKNALYYFPNKNLLDLNIIEQIEEPQTNVYEHFYNQYPSNKNINKIIPIVKHYEYCENIYIKVLNIINKPIPKHFNFYNNKGCIAFFGIEKNGIKIDEKLFIKYFSNINPVFSIENNKIYTNYNLYSTTRRPSNSFNSINFAALNKESGERKSFIPENDKFIEIDISSYHPVLAGKLIGYKFTKPVYEEFAEQMKINVSSAKEKFFNVIYGGNFNGLENVEFFVKIKKYILNNYEIFNNCGEVIVPISSYCYKKETLGDMNPYKLFNYMLQNIETSMNILILWDIFQVLKGKKTKLVLYCYDSFMFDYSDGEPEIILELEKIFQKYKLNTKTKQGLNYNFDQSL